MNNFFKIIWAAFGLLAVAMPSTVCGQTYSNDFVDGRLYFKIKGGYESTVQNRTAFQSSNLPYIAALESIFAANSVTIVEKEFEITADTLLNHIYVVNFTDFSEADTLVAQIKALGEVDYAEKVPIYYTSVITNPTNDPLANTAQQWSLDRVNAWGNCMTTQPSTRAVVAIIDNAVFMGHPDLVDNIWTGPGGIHGADFSRPNNATPLDFNPNPPIARTNTTDVTISNADYFHRFSHGTHCAGIAGAVTNNGQGIGSISRNHVRIMGIKLTPDDAPNPRAVTGDLPAAILWATNNGADIISMSIGSMFSNGFDQGSRTLQAAVNAANDRGTICIAAAGNENQSGLRYPAACTNVYAVASTDEQDRKSVFSNFGTWIDIAAPGSNILSCAIEENLNPIYTPMSGTSMACPMVAGLAGALLAQRRSVNDTNFPVLNGTNAKDRVARLISIINNTSRNIGGTSPQALQGLLGAGRIDASAACATFCTTPITLTAPTQPASPVSLTPALGTGTQTFGITATGNAGTGNVTGIWYSPLNGTTSTGSVSGSVFSQSYLLRPQGSYTTCFTAVSATNAACNASRCWTTEVTCPLTAAFNFSTLDIAPGGTFTISTTGSTPVVAPVTYRWSLDGAALSTTPPASGSITALGGHTLRLVVSNGVCSVETSRNIIVHTADPSGFAANDAYIIDDAIVTTGTTTVPGNRYITTGHHTGATIRTIVCRDALGTILWQQNYPLPASLDHSYAQLIEDNGAVWLYATVNNNSNYGLFEAQIDIASGGFLQQNTYMLNNAAAAPNNYNSFQPSKVVRANGRVTVIGSLRVFGWPSPDTSPRKRNSDIGIFQILNNQATNIGRLRIDDTRVSTESSREWIRDMIPTKDGGYIAVGCAETNGNFVLKLNANAGIEWYRFPHGDDITILSNDIVGYEPYGFFNIVESTTCGDGYYISSSPGKLFHIDNNGNILDETYFQEGAPQAKPSFLTQKSSMRYNAQKDGLVFLYLGTRGAGNGSQSNGDGDNNRYYLFETNLQGDLRWQRQFTTPSLYSKPETNQPTAYLSPDGGYFIALPNSSATTNIYRTDATGFVDCAGALTTNQYIGIQADGTTSTRNTQITLPAIQPTAVVTVFNATNTVATAAGATTCPPATTCPTAAFNFTVSRICSTTLPTIINSSTTGTSAWRFVNRTTGAILTAFPTTGIAGGEWDVTLTVTNNGCSRSVTKHLSVMTMPRATFTQNLAAIRSANFNLPFPTGTDYSCNTTYQWQFGDGTGSQIQNPGHVYPTCTTYVVTVTVANEVCPSTSSTQSVAFIPVGAINITGNRFLTGGTTQLTANANAATSYWWSNNTTGTQSSISATITANGIYTVTATNNSGCGATATVLVSCSSPPTVSITGAATSCTATSTTLTATGGSTYLWSNGITTAANILNTSGIYTVTVTNSVGCSNITSVNVTIANLAANLTANNNTICLGQSTTLSAVATGGTNYTYTWSGTGTGSTRTVTPTITTTYTVTVTANGACNTTRSITITVNSLSITITGNTSITPGQSTILTASGTGATSFAWSNGQLTDAITVSPTASTTYTVTATNAVGCRGTATVLVTVACTPPVVTLAATPTTICVGQAATLTATQGTGFTYAWSGTGTGTGNIRTVAPTVTTTYTVTVTSGGCTATRTVSVAAQSPPTVTLTAAATALCAGQTTTLTATGGGTYAWSGGTDGTTPNIRNGIIAATTYTVTVTSGNCTATKSITISTTNSNFTLSATVAGNPFNIEANIPLTATTTATNPTFAWAGPNGFASNLQNPVLSDAIPQMSGIYTVTVTNTCGATKTATVSITVNCTKAGYVAIDGYNQPAILTNLICDATVFSTDGSINPLGPLYCGGLNPQNPTNACCTAQKWIVNGKLIMDQSYVFYEGSDIAMCPGATIEVALTRQEGPGGEPKVIFNETTIHGINRLWNTIKVNDGKLLRLNGGTVKGALNGVSLSDGARLSTTNTAFSNNYIGINMVQVGTNPPSLISDAIIINNPNGTDLKPNWLPTYLESQPFAGIKLQNVNFAPLISAANPTVSQFNTINGTSFGIYAENSYLNIKGFYFDDINGRGSVSQGAGIYTQGGYTKVIGNGSAHATFRGCQTGILANASSTDVLNTDFDHLTQGTTIIPTQIGIRAETGTIGVGDGTTANACNITASQIGVDVVNCGKFNIQRNTINLFPLTGEASLNGAIRLSSAGGLIKQAGVTRNVINVKHALYGIWANGITKCSVVDNDINLQSTFLDGGVTKTVNHAGIQSNNSTIFYSCNNILGPGKALKNGLFTSDAYSPSAILAGADNSTYSCNKTDETYTGILMQGICNTAVLQGSTIGTHHFGLNFTQSLGLQAQDGRSNQWTGVYTGTDKAARHEANIISNQSGIFYTPSSVPFKPIDAQIEVKPTAIIGDWFRPGSSSLICTQTGNVCTPRPLAMMGGSGDATMQQLIASDIPTTETYEIEQLWESQKQLYETLKEGDPAVYSNDPILSAFVTDKADETIGQLYEVKEEVSNAFTPSATLELQLTARETDIKLLSTQIAALDDAYTTGSLTQSDWEVQRTALLNLLDAATTQYKSLSLQYETIKDNGIDVAKSLNDAIQTTAIYEANTKTVNDIYLRTIAKNNLEAVTTTDKSTINYIAVQCPYTGGTAVYTARALQASIRKDTFYNDTENCFAQGVNYRTIKPKVVDNKSIEALSVKLYPNPASDFFTLAISKTQETVTTIELIDVLGRVVQQNQLAVGFTKTIVPTIGLGSGVYYCRVSNESGILQTSKIVVSK
jgi:Subtilase family/Secretion system C-terminal sorting domain/PKD domain